MIRLPSAPHPTYATLYRFLGRPPRPCVVGKAVGQRIAVGKIRVVRSSEDFETVEEGDVIVAASTEPTWEPVMKRASAVVTDHGGLNSHTATLCREVGMPCVVGTGHATAIFQTGEVVTVSCAEGAKGNVYPGEVPFEAEEFDLATLPATETKLLLNVGDPAQACSFAMLPSDGVGLVPLESIIANAIRVHPSALCRHPNLRDAADLPRIDRILAGENPREFFLRKLSEGLGQIATAFYPRPVMVRTSDLMTNEYAVLLGGAEFEPREENPTLGFRGASRYLEPRYADAFRLECLALKRVREGMGLTNVKVMIPFCRTVAEARGVVATMAEHGLVQGQNGLEIYGMCDVPSNALDADEFLQVFDGFSIDTDELTQLTLGVDRGSDTVSHLFDEGDFAVKSLIVMAIDAAKRQGKWIGIGGQASSGNRSFVRWLVNHGIDAISLDPDALLRTHEVVLHAEEGKRHAAGVRASGTGEATREMS